MAVSQWHHNFRTKHVFKDLQIKRDDNTVIYMYLSLSIELNVVCTVRAVEDKMTYTCIHTHTYTQL